MTIDGRSLLVVAAALCVVLGFIVLALERRLSQPMPGLRLWAIANFALGGGAAVNAMQGLAPMWLPALLGTALVLAGRAAMVAALREFDRRSVPGRLLAGLWLALVLALALTLLVWPSYQWRGMAMVAGMAVFAGWGALTVLVGGPVSVSRMVMFVGLSGLVLCNLWRAWAHAQALGSPGVLPLNAPEVAVYIALLMILDVQCNVGFVLLITDRMHEWVLQLARTDHLTGTLSRGALYTQAQRDLHRARRQKTSTAAFIVDIDRFKTINDDCGHAAGDAVLRNVALHGRSVLRCTDLFGRYGGDEFVAVLPETDLPTATAIAERLRLAIGDPTPDTPDGLPPVTVSIGVAAVDAGVQGIDDLIAEADHALYDAKRSGRNRTAVADGAATRATPLLRVIHGST